MDFKLDDGDIIIENFNIVTIDNKEQLAQNIQEELSVWKNEWFANLEYGVDWLIILDSKQGKTKAIYEVNRVIKKYKDIKKIGTFNYTLTKDRKYTLTLELITQDDTALIVEV